MVNNRMRGKGGLWVRDGMGWGVGGGGESYMLVCICVDLKRESKKFHRTHFFV